MHPHALANLEDVVAVRLRYRNIDNSRCSGRIERPHHRCDGCEPCSGSSLEDVLKLGWTRAGQRYGVQLYKSGER
jgi:hypothetical protein